jgi:hypothetical protein
MPAHQQMDAPQCPFEDSSPALQASPLPRQEALGTQWRRGDTQCVAATDVLHASAGKPGGRLPLDTGAHVATHACMHTRPQAGPRTAPTAHSGPSP